MFHYLTNSKIQKTKNGIEVYFIYLKIHIDIHRGLATVQSTLEP